jgi:glutamate transport system permease protein
VNVVIDNAGAILRGFATTLSLSALSALICLAAGTLLAVLRVGPIPPLRWIGTAYVNVVRNTPLVLVFLVVVHGLPEIGLRGSFFTRAVIALSAYHAAFVCEVVRSGILTVPAGQAEAARALGMTFGQNLRLVIVPQAVRAVVPPLTSVLIALVKNSAIAEAFGVLEATGTMDNLITEHADALVPVIVVVAAGYVAVTLSVSAFAKVLERRVAVSL